MQREVLVKVIALGFTILMTVTAFAADDQFSVDQGGTVKTPDVRKEETKKEETKKEEPKKPQSSEGPVNIIERDLAPPTQNCYSADGKAFKCN